MEKYELGWDSSSDNLIVCTPMVKGVTEDEGMGAVKREETRWFLVRGLVWERLWAPYRHLDALDWLLDLRAVVRP